MRVRYLCWYTCDVQGRVLERLANHTGAGGAEKEPEAAEVAADAQAAAHQAALAQAAADSAASCEQADSRPPAASARPCQGMMHRRSSRAWRASLFLFARLAITDTCSLSADTHDRQITFLNFLQACVNSSILACMLSACLIAFILH